MKNPKQIVLGVGLGGAVAIAGLIGGAAIAGADDDATTETTQAPISTDTTIAAPDETSTTTTNEGTTFRFGGFMAHRFGDGESPWGDGEKPWADVETPKDFFSDFADLEQLVADGTMTQEQADHIESFTSGLSEFEFDGEFSGGFMGSIHFADGESPWSDGESPFDSDFFDSDFFDSDFFDSGLFSSGLFNTDTGTMADKLGINKEELATALEDGKTIPEIAEANGIDMKDLFGGLGSFSWHGLADHNADQDSEG